MDDSRSKGLMLVWAAFCLLPLFPVGAQPLVVNPVSMMLEEGESEYFTIVLSMEPSGDVTVAIVTPDAGLSVDKALLTFTQTNWNVPQSVKITAEQDPGMEDNDKQLILVASGGGYSGGGGIEVSPKEVMLKFLSETVQLSAEIKTQHGSMLVGVPLEWSSTDSSVAVVDSTGKVIAVKNGTTMISAALATASGTSKVVVDAPDIVSDRDALTIFYYATGGGKTWVKEDNWLSDKPLEEWFGVRTNEAGDVTVINLPGNGLKGQLLPELGRLSKLEWLRLQRNALYGELPRQLASANYLRHIDLSHNLLTGSIPSSFLTLTSLRTFNWGGNNQNDGLCAPSTGEFLDWLSQVGEISGQRCDQSDRETLGVLYGAMDGPNWKQSTGWLGNEPLENWHGIRTDSLGRVSGLDLEDNGLSGLLHGEISALTAMTTLRVSNNALDGPLPQALLSLSLDDFKYAGTELCVPSSEYFSDWIASIPMHDGTGKTCPPFTDRDILRVLYNQAGGNNWSNNDNWLDNDVPLGDWYGVKTHDDGERVRALNLNENNLSGIIPVELGQLDDLESLLLRDNRLKGTIPSSLGEIPRLIDLVLKGNLLKGTIPIELSTLEQMKFLELENNQLSGPIPPELGRLPNLENLYLRNNQFKGWIPPELGNARTLRFLDLGDNTLDGPIPSELGNLEFLELLALDKNPGLSGPLPIELTKLRALYNIYLNGTSVCLPRELFGWFIGRGRAAPCNAAEESQASMIQVIQSLNYPVPLIAGKEALLRVFVTVKEGIKANIPHVRATLFNEGQPYSVDIPSKPILIPTDLSKAEESLDQSANAWIPAEIIRPGMEMVVEIDPEGSLDPDLGVAERIPATGREEVHVREVPTLDLTVIPFILQGNPDLRVIEVVDEMADDPDGSDLLWHTQNLLPVNKLELHIHAPVRVSSIDSHDLLGYVEILRTAEGGSGYWMGMITGEIDGERGLGIISGWASHVPLWNNYTLFQSGEIVAHEFGHNMSLTHAPCGSVRDPDPNYPYATGKIGSPGLDPRTRELVSSTTPDIMSYCSPGWLGEYGFNRALQHRLIWESPLSATRPDPDRVVLLWGGIKAGQPYLNPPVVMDTRSSAPPIHGEWQIVGSGGGVNLFSVNFDMKAISHADGQESFAFAVPIRPEWEGVLEEISLFGPGGMVATMDSDTDPPMIIVRDRATGQVQAILRDVDPADMSAVAISLGMDLNSLEVLTSSGILR